MPAGEKTKELWKNPKYREHMSEIHKGQVAWNKGLTKQTDERVAKYAEAISKATKGRIPWNKNVPCSVEHKEKLSEAHKGKTTWIKDKYHTEETKEKMRNLWTDERKKKQRLKMSGKNNPHYGNHLSEKHRKKIGKALKNLPKEFFKKCLRRRIPTSLEEKFLNIVKRYSLPYKYVGNGKFFIERFNPDFINTNNEKIAIEVYARYYKLRNSISIEEWKKERSKVFAKYGWKIYYFNEIEVNEDNILKILRERV